LDPAQVSRAAQLRICRPTRPSSPPCDSERDATATPRPNLVQAACAQADRARVAPPGRAQDFPRAVPSSCAHAQRCRARARRPRCSDRSCPKPLFRARLSVSRPRARSRRPAVSTSSRYSAATLARRQPTCPVRLEGEHAVHVTAIFLASHHRGKISPSRAPPLRHIAPPVASAPHVVVPPPQAASVAAPCASKRPPSVLPSRRPKPPAVHRFPFLPWKPHRRQPPSAADRARHHLLKDHCRPGHLSEHSSSGPRRLIDPSPASPLRPLHATAGSLPR
jgi:hypothetical protein